MGIFEIWLPIAGIKFNIILLVVIGFCVGTLGGFFGVGGAWIVTPALNIFGFNMSFAIGTDLAHIFGKSIIATRKHNKLGNVDWKLGLTSIVGSIIGVEVGAQVVMMLEKIGNVGPVVRWLYIVLLFGLGIYMVYDYYSATRPKKNATSEDQEQIGESSSALARKLHAFRIPPMMSFPTSGITSVSFWIIFAIFFLTGFLSGLLGVGGGFILLPSLIYLVGCPTTVAVGTSLLSVAFMSGYACFSYSLKGRTELVAAGIMLMGAAVGAQIGVLATRYVRGLGIRLLFAIMIICAGASVLLKQGQESLNSPVLGTIAGYAVMIAAGGMTLLIFLRLINGAKKERKSHV
ncbi:MAG: sulfite exporter TauE/SafE family protein [candidate division Zixibacteria bacterium]|nr:sulfite exporter TauE/SafE family protein [candidate division Zixibacteria bacterium]